MGGIELPTALGYGEQNCFEHNSEHNSEHDSEHNFEHNFEHNYEHQEKLCYYANFVVFSVTVIIKCLFSAYFLQLLQASYSSITVRSVLLTPF